ncbi:FAD-dependent oxidoreductase [Massilibacteroides sp.]|uniref:FAD-dependent oxidoreductase n=1 Tax=Massilibacteroides sp. TaxID=2034766 RepID=UPI0026342ED2|nr:FAD-dependent oxidoreductase [Massilibacteroides sp.]MDD4516089.1 FAD-dependent oxidoreductase [Massilibacteroides sp.]
MKYLIVGGVAGGATVAARLRRLDEKANIILFERGQYVSYANCGLPYYIGGTIAERDKLFVQTVKGFTERFNIDIRTEQEVLSINDASKEILVRNLITGDTYQEKYDKLILSPGAAPIKPKIQGIESDLIFSLRTVPDTDRIKNYICNNQPRKALVVGAGFIGLEMVENLHDLNIDVTIVEKANQVMAPLDFSMAAIVHQHLHEKRVQLILEDGVSKFENKGKSIIAHLESGKQVEADMVILSIGVRPEINLATEAGLKIGSLGGISVNEYMQTSNPDIYALGDAVEVTHLVTGKPALIPLAGPANKQGRIVADNIINGNKHKYSGSIGTSIAKVFNLTVATAGANAKQLKRESIDYISSYTHSASHAGYYPGAIPLSMKILFSPTDGRLYGAQVVGVDGADKRIEMLAQVIRNGGGINDLIDIEQAYAPPFSSAKDPVNMAGFVAENILSEKVKIIHWREIEDLPSSTLLVDVRTPIECSLGTIPGAISIPVDELRDRLQELPKDKDIVIFCAVGLRGYLAWRILAQNGYKNIRNLSGGYKTWSLATWKEENKNVMPLDRPTTEDGQEEKTSVISIDACGMQCPGPVMQLEKHYSKLKVGEQLSINVTDPGFGKDITTWCKNKGAYLVSLENKNGIIHAVVKRTDSRPI